MDKPTKYVKLTPEQWLAKQAIAARNREAKSPEARRRASESSARWRENHPEKVAQYRENAKRFGSSNPERAEAYKALRATPEYKAAAKAKRQAKEVAFLIERAWAQRNISKYWLDQMLMEPSPLTEPSICKMVYRYYPRDAKRLGFRPVPQV